MILNLFDKGNTLHFTVLIKIHILSLNPKVSSLKMPAIATDRQITSSTQWLSRTDQLRVQRPQQKQELLVARRSKSVSENDSFLFE